ncbi:AMP-dependent synthetase [Marinobacter sp. NP-6]|uniref:AMP-binding protein n=1 Tax=Marinobacter sp. NP-6 TaxID=2488666 RepID=UPI000FCBB9C2|nr:AMP-binding protein [Marinobacter sp. NP-6]RUT76970.1 AMP-dependent synthetase [Marinobacter sp. NP-6]
MENNKQFLDARNFLLRKKNAYEEAIAGFNWPRLENFNWALDYFDKMARGNLNPALQFVDDNGGNSSYTFDDMASRSDRVANFMAGLGAKRGDRILLMLGNEVALWEVMLAAFKIGAVIIPASELLVEEDLDDRIKRGQVSYIVTNSKHTHKFSGYADGMDGAICVDGEADGWINYTEADACSARFTPEGITRSDDPLLLYFTSGTTSKPKLVLHSHQSYPVGSLSTMYWIGLQPGDVHLNISSPGWAKHAWSCFFAPWNAEACIFIYNSVRFNAKSFLKVLTNYPVTTLCAPATVWRMLIQEDLREVRSSISLRELVGAGEPLNPEVIGHVQKAWGITVRDGFGQSETTALVGNSPGQEVRPGSMGQPLPGYEVVLLDPEGHVSDEGEVAIKIFPRPVGLMLGYADSPEKTAEVMSDGYYRTGDTAKRDSDGYITFIGRADDVFKSSDYRISPFELESALMEHEAVAEVAVVPVPDPVRLTVPKAYVVLSGNFQPDSDTAKKLFGFIAERMSPYKRVRFIEFIDEFPKTISGKIRRVELRKLESTPYDGNKNNKLGSFHESILHS